jgi:O-acetylhomoserine/O-acetylserine sulfhydrylase-like pyridoxal-dependent enzyme
VTEHRPIGRSFSPAVGGLVGFEIKGGKDAGRKFVDALQLLAQRG